MGDYGPCPKCNSYDRWGNRRKVVCRNCGHIERRGAGPTLAYRPEAWGLRE